MTHNVNGRYCQAEPNTVVAGSTGRECFSRDASDLASHVMLGIVTDVVDSRLLDFVARLERVAHDYSHVSLPMVPEGEADGITTLEVLRPAYQML
jgi:hypothetical protein